MKEDESQSRLAPIDKDRRLIEEQIPIKEINAESSREKRQISSIHIWWARRPLQASRAAIFSSLLKVNLGDKKQKIELLKKIVQFEKLKNNQDMTKARRLIIDEYNGKLPRVLDMFAGGGSIPLESLRLGCETYSLDLNPVAVLVQRTTIEYPQIFNHKKSLIDTRKTIAEFLEYYGRKLIKSTKEDIGKYYPNEEKDIAYLWARTVKCSNPHCEKHTPLIKQFWLSKKSNNTVALKLFVEGQNIRFEIRKGGKIDFEPSKGTMKSGSAKCVFCNSTISRNHIKSEFEKNGLGKIMLCIIEKSNSGKNYRIPTENDIKKFEQAVNDLDKKEKIDGFSLIPDEPLPEEGSLGISPYWCNEKDKHNKKWASLFNERQLLTLTSLIKNIHKIRQELKDKIDDDKLRKAIISYLALMVDKLADYNSTLSTWHPRNQQVKHLFGMQTIPITWDYCEVNPFSGSTGSLEGALKSIIKTINYATLDLKNPKIKIIRGTATRLPFNDKFFDAIITDPPYYDAVPYSELSDFFYVWLKRSLYKEFPEDFSTLLTPKSSEIVQNPVRHLMNREEAKKFYESEMTKAFKEANRTLKDNGIFVVVFAHKSTSAWETLISSLLNSRFIVTASWPLKTEQSSRLRATNSAALASSIFIVCRKRKSEEEGYFSEVKEELKKKIKAKLDQFWSHGIRGADFFISAIGPAVEVFGKYKRVMKLSGEEVSVAELLDLVREIVTDYSLEKILHGRHMGKVDEQTRFYLLWRWAYDDNDVPYDDARKLAQALGTEADELLNKKDMLEKKGDKVNLMEPWQRKKNAHLGEPKGGIPAPMIDVIHKACLLWEKGNKQELSEFIENSGYADDDTIWNVAQAISEVLPDGNKEKQLIQGLLASKHSISKDVSSKQGKLGEYFK